MPLQQETINKLKGMTARRDLRVPKPKYASLLERATKSRYKPGQRKSSQEVQKRNREENKAYKARYLQFFEEVSREDLALPSEKLPHSFDFEINDTVRPRPSKELETVLRYATARQEVIDTFFPAVVSGATALEHAVEVLGRFSLDAAEEQLCYFPGVSSPVDHWCPYCDDPFNKSSKVDINNHLLKCHKVALLDHLIDEAWQRQINRAIWLNISPDMLRTNSLVNAVSGDVVNNFLVLLNYVIIFTMCMT
ncbi:MAG: hypothetical protein M1816_000065 [Peltula sp. TS41687]|nr:MAG: hypothetical protein M1816_000065 [Peltula sp. TS41687]